MLYYTITVQLWARPASPPPFGEGSKILNSLRACDSPGCHQLHMVIVAKLQEPSRSAFLRSVVIFVKYREVSTRTTLPNFIGNCRDSIVFAFWQRHGQKRERGSICQGAHVRQVLSCFNSTPLANQDNSPSQPE